MTQRKKTPEELEIAAHNRLKGTICFHITSAIGQLACVKRKLSEYYNGCNDTQEINDVRSLNITLTHIEAATRKFKETTYTNLSIGDSPSSARNRPPRKRKPYAT